MIAAIQVHRDKLPEMKTYTCMGSFHTIDSGLATFFFVHSRADIETIECYRGPYQKEVRAMAAELHKLFPAEPEAEPEDEYVLRHVHGEVKECGNCKFPAPTRWSRVSGVLCARCKVCTDMPNSDQFTGMCYHANVLLAAIEKSRPVEIKGCGFDELRRYKAVFDDIAIHGIGSRDAETTAAHKACCYVAALLEAEIIGRETA